MKSPQPIRCHSSLAAARAVLAALLTVTPAHAASLYWTGGSDTWDTTNLKWGTASGGPYNTTAWNNTTHAAYIADLRSASPQPVATLGANITCGGVNSPYGGSGSVINAGSGPYTLTLGVTGNNTFSPFTGTTARVLTINAAIAGASGKNFLLSGGSLTLNGVNTFAGTITISGSAPSANLTIGAAGKLGSGNYSAAISIASGCNLYCSSSADQTWSGNISGAGTLTKSNSSTLTLSGGSGSLANTGGLVISSGTVAMTGGNQVANTIPLTVNGTLNAGSNGQIFGTLNGSGTINVAGSTFYTKSANSGTFSGSINGIGAYQKELAGTETLSGPNTYTGNTAISGGTLALSGSGTLATASISIGPGATFDVSAQTPPILAASQNLLGTGSVNGNLSTVATTTIYPGTNGTAGTLTFNNSLTLDSSTKVQLDLSSAYNGANDQIVLSGTAAVLTPNGAQITINSAGTLDSSVNDYVLIQLTGSGSPVFSGNFNNTPAWAGTTPSNAANYSIVTSGTQVTLHYSSSINPTGVALATPASVTRNQPTLLTVTVTPGASPTSTGLAVTADLSSIGGPASQAFYDDGTHGDVTAGDNIFSYNATVATGTSLGGKNLPATIADAQSRNATSNIALTVTALSETWGASPADANWGTAGNWVSGISPAAGDLVYFDTSTQLSPNLETNYSVDSVTFNSGAGSYTLGGSGTLTLTGSGVTNLSANAQTLNVAVAMGASQTFNAASGEVTLGGVISGSGKSLTKSGASALTLAADNSYDGGTMLNAGQLNINNGGDATHSAIGTGALTLGAGTMIDNTSGSAVTLLTNNSQVWNGSFTALGAADTTHDLNLGTGNVVLGATPTVTVNNSSTLTLGGIVSGNFGMTKAGTGTLMLSGANSYTGTTTLSAGTLKLGASNVIPDGTGKGNVAVDGSLDLNGNSETVNGLSGAGVVDNTAAGTSSTLALGANNQTSTFSGVVRNSGSTATLNVTKTGTGTLTLSGANTLSGAVTVNGGTLSLGIVNPLNNASGIAMATGTTLNPTVLSVTLAAPIATAGTVKINAPAINGNGDQTFKEFFVNGGITGSGNVIFNSTLNANTIQTVTLTSAATYSGTTLLDTSGGTASEIIVKLGANNALPTTTVVTIDGQAGAGSGRCAEINLNGFNQTLAGLTNTTRSLRLQRVVNSDVSAAATLTINNSADCTFSGGLGNSASQFSVSGSTTPGSTNGNNFGLTKSGSATFTLTGAISYRGNTTVNAGTLSLGSANASNDLSTVTIATTGATLNLAFAGTDTVDKLVIGTTQMAAGIYGAGNLAIPQITGSGTLTVTTGPAGFSSWISGSFTNGTVPVGQQGPTDNPAGDGISNLLKYAIAGQDPTVPNTSISTFSANTLSFTKRPGTSGLTYAIVQSSDLGVSVPWAEVPAGPTYTNDASTISFTLTPGTPAANFIRLQVVEN